LPTVFATVAGYAGALEAYLARWQQHLERKEEAKDGSARAAARRALFDLWTLSLNIPIARPYYLRLKGAYQVLDGNLRAAELTFRSGLHAAQTLGMPCDEALAQLDLARLALAQGKPHEGSLGCAERLFSELGCRHELDRLHRLRPHFVA
jgi:hypothetical protein